MFVVVVVEPCMIGNDVVDRWLSVCLIYWLCPML